MTQPGSQEAREPTAEERALLREWTRQRVSAAEQSRRLDISRRTLGRWREADPEIAPSRRTATPESDPHLGARVAALAARGARPKDIARLAGIPRGNAVSEDVAWAQACEEWPELREAWEIGRSTLHDELMGRLLTKARAGETAPLIFALKILFGYRDRGPEFEIHSDLRVRIEMPAALSPEQYAALQALEVSARPEQRERALRELSALPESE